MFIDALYICNLDELEFMNSNKSAASDKIMDELDAIETQIMELTNKANERKEQIRSLNQQTELLQIHIRYKKDLNRYGFAQ